MSRDEHRTEPTSMHPLRDEESPQQIAARDDQAESKPDESEQLDRSSKTMQAAGTRGLAPNQRRRKRRARKLLLATILTGVFVGILMWSRRGTQRTPSAEVLSLAPKVLFEQACDAIRDTQGDTLQITEYPVDDEMVGAIAGLDSLETLILDQGAVTDAAIETIASLPKLQHLRLRLSPISDEGMKRIAKIETLWYLNLPQAECTAQGVGELAALPRLRQLRLGLKHLGNEVTREIAKITSLRGIHLIGIAVTDEGLKTLAGMQYLESLYLDDSAVTEAGWEWLFREHPHLHVHVNQSHHDRDPKAHKHHEGP